MTIGFLRLTGLLVALSALPAAAQTRQLTVGGVVRTYALHLPPGAGTAGKAAALIVALHGGGGTGEQIRRQLHLDPVATRENVVVAYPDGLGHGWNRGWNDGRSFDADRFGGTKPDDVAFIRALVQDISRTVIIDPARVFATGASNGGFMSFRLACEASDVFAAVAPIIASLSPETMRTCKPARPVGVYMITGTADPLVPNAGGPVGFKGERGTAVAADEAFATMRGVSGCPPDPKTVATGPTIDTIGAGDVCAEGRQVRHDRIRGGGHQIPRRDAARQPLVERLLGPRNTQIEAAEEIWAYFKGQAR